MEFVVNKAYLLLLTV